MLRASQLICLLIVLAYPPRLMAQPGAGDDNAENGFSPLHEITTANVGTLALAFSFRTGASGAHTSEPLPLGTLLFVLTPFPHKLFALDLEKPEAPVKWHYEPAADEIAEGFSCCGAPTGGMNASGNRIYLNTLDGHVIALNSQNGGVLWDSSVAAPRSGEILTTPPLPVHDAVIVGTSGDDAGARGSLIALDGATGTQRWKMFSTGPDKEVGISDQFHPADSRLRGTDLGIATWPPAAWQQGGGGLAGPLIFDPVTGQLFQQTGHPAPWNPDQRDGDNRWTSGLFARDPQNGTAKWFDSINPHDPYSLGAGGGILLAGDQAHRILIHPDPEGYLMVLDAGTGKILSAAPYLPITATRGIDMATSQPICDPQYMPHPGSTVRDICPAWPAGSNALPALSPQTGYVYLPVAQTCMDMQTVATSYLSGTLYAGATVRMKPAGGRSLGALIAWDLAANRPAWTISEPLPLRAGALVTAGGLVFYGTLDGMFKAVDAHTGKLLWHYRAQSGIVARPVTYQGPDGHQYVAVIAGSGGLTGTKSAQEIDARDATAAHGLAALLGPLRQPQDPVGTLIVFRLP